MRQHLVDMDHVTLFAHVNNVALDDGIRFEATGAGAVRDSIRRMLAAHAATMNRENGWAYESAEIENGATLTVRARRHLMIARGLDPHK